MKKSALKFLMTIAVFSGFLSSSLANTVMTPAQCTAVLKPMLEEQRTALLTKLIDSGVVLGAFHLEALIRSGFRQNRLPGIHIGSAGANSPSINRKPFKDLSLVLKSENQLTGPWRRSFAEDVVKYLETEMFKLHMQTVQMQNEVNFKHFHFGGLTKPSLKQADQAWIAFHEAMKTPEGRELLTVAIQNSNSSMAMVAYRGQTTSKGRVLYLASVFSSGAVFGWLTGTPISPELLVAGPLSTLIPFGLPLLNVKPIAAAQLRLNKVIESRRLKKLMAADLTPTPNLDTDVAPKVVDTGDLSNVKDLDLVFDREIVKVKAQDLKNLEPKLDAGDFASVSTFGGDLIKRVDKATDLLGLMSQRMNLFEKDVLRLNDSTAEGRLKISAEEIRALADRALDNSADILQDGEQLQTYLEALQKALTDHLSTGQSALDSGKLSATGAVEMGDILEELHDAQASLETSTKILPLANQVVQAQRSILRDLRSNLLALRLSHSNQIEKLVSAIEKLKSIQINRESVKK
jgi:hypothetical protein